MSCVDHETLALFGFDSAAVFDAIARDGRVLPAYRERAALARVQAATEPGATADDRAAARALLERLWSRGLVLAARLCGDDDADALEAPAGDEAADLAFADMPAYALYALWYAVLTGDRARGGELAARLQGSSRRVVRDAAALAMRGDRSSA